MPFSFPSNPSVGATSTQNGREYRYAGNNSWELIAASGGSGLTWSSVPASPTATGTAGSIAYDGDFLYVATAANTWERAALSTWTVPVITIGTQPSNQTASSGAATFSVSASVTQSASLSYQWQRSTDGGSTFNPISGATSNSLSLSGLASGDNGYQYRVVVSATGGATSVTSSAATLTVSVASKVFSSVSLNANPGGTVSGAGTSTLTLARTNNSLQLELRFTIPAGTLTVTKPNRAGAYGLLRSATSMGIAGQQQDKDGSYYFEFPASAAAANSTYSQNFPSGFTGTWEGNPSVGETITFTIA